MKEREPPACEQLAARLQNAAPFQVLMGGVIIRRSPNGVPTGS